MTKNNNNCKLPKNSKEQNSKLHVQAKQIKLYLSQINSQFGGRLSKFKGSQLWNRLPNDLIDITSLESFKKTLRYFLIICDPLKTGRNY